MSGEEEIDVVVNVLKRYEVEEAAAVMGNAFGSSPAYCYILSSFTEAGRIKALTWIFRKNLYLMMDRCQSACKCVRIKDDPQEKIVATFLWTPSAHEEIDDWTMIRYGGALEMPFRLGLSGFMTLMGVVKEFNEMWEKTMRDNSLDGKYESWTSLERMCVLPSYQGKKVGTKALTKVLEETTGLVRLCTQEERNVRFYQRLGFKVIAEMDMGKEGMQYHNWCMMKEMP